MNITEFIEELEQLKEKVGDIDVLLCNQNGEVHYYFSTEDWSDMETRQLLIKGDVRE